MKASRSGTVAVSASQRVHNTGVYLARHWQLYLIFILPAVVLTLIFKYMPMGGILIAFQDYNPLPGHPGQRVGRSRALPALHVLCRISQRYLVNTLKPERLRPVVGLPRSHHSGFPAQAASRAKKSNRRSSWCCICPTSSRVIVLCGMVRVLLSVTGPLNGLLHTSINLYDHAPRPSAPSTSSAASGRAQAGPPSCTRPPSPMPART